MNWFFSKKKMIKCTFQVERIELKETLNVVLEQLEDTKDNFRKQGSELKQSKSVGRELLSRVQELETQVYKYIDK